MPQFFLVNSNEESSMCDRNQEHLFTNAAEQNVMPASAQYIPPPENETPHQQLQRLGLVSSTDVIANSKGTNETGHLIPPQIKW